MYKKSTLLASLMLFYTLQASASFIDYGAYISDNATGLDWLDVTTTVNLSYNNVSSQFGTGGDYEGFRYATLEEFRAMVSGNSNITTHQNYGQKSFDLPESGSIDILVAVLGSTLDTWSMATYGMSFDEHTGKPAGTQGITRGLLISPDFDPCAPYDCTILAELDDVDWNRTDLDYAWSSSKGFAPLRADKNYASFSLGSFLVRDTLPVPEPSTLLLFVFGLAGLSTHYKNR